ncbi:myosin heavy chain kinase B-like [Patiria miniata]|uniref:Alpha-type protein kinase domain-containing protein n=1 Tax=Patiria miniata TaxID=46514 RepID=A0A914AGN9_PATMI|nr:myosin heavy chain kinase B-like [Patiria miniata]
MGNNQSNTSLPIEGRGGWVVFENDWFAEGRSRRVYRGTYQGERHMMGRCVVKIYKEQWSVRLGEMSYRADIRATDRAQEMAKLFNSTYMINGYSIEFTKLEIARINSSAGFRFLGFVRIPKRVKGKEADERVSSSVMIPKGDSVVIENYLEGEFIHFLSNTAYQDEEVQDTVSAAFSHFTYQASNGQILVCDLKGVRGERGYVFTDPAIHSHIDPGNYGSADLGDVGILKFFENHTCCALCEGFQKLDPADVTSRVRRQARALTPGRSTTHLHEFP